MTPWDCIGWFVVFYPRKLNDPASWLGHCSLYGHNADGTWVFLDPDRAHFSVKLAHAYEEVNGLIAERLALASEILYFDAPPKKWAIPPIGPQTCASICGHILGVRASTPWTLRRRLIANGARDAMEFTYADP